MRKRNPSSIDATDAKIVRALQLDGRQHNTEIARALGLAEATVRKRVERLLREQVFQIAAWVDPLKVGYQHYAIIEIEVRPAALERATRRVAAFPEAYFLGVCAGSQRLVAAAVFRSNEHFHEFMTARLARVPGIRGTSTLNVTRIVKREYGALDPLLVGDVAAPVAIATPAARARRSRRRASMADNGGRTWAR
jgi:Lrp/AsnC family transcriptional regulator, regulator for asnA, asnC and gidA